MPWLDEHCTMWAQTYRFVARWLQSSLSGTGSTTKQRTIPQCPVCIAKGRTPSRGRGGGALDLPDRLLLHCCGQSVHDDLVLAGKKVGVYHPLYRGSVPVHNDRVDVALGYGHLHYGGPLTAARFLFGHICFVGIACHDDVS